MLIKKHREIRKSTGISVPVPDETSSQVTGRGRRVAAACAAGPTSRRCSPWTRSSGRPTRNWRAPGTRWPSASAAPAPGSRRAASTRTRSPARSPRSARPSAATRRSARSPSTALNELGADRSPQAGGGFTVATASLPLGLRDSIAALIGERPKLPFRTTPAVPRGEAALTRTDPVVRDGRQLRAVRGAGPAGPRRAPARPPLRRHQDFSGVRNAHHAAAGPLPLPDDAARTAWRRPADRGGRPGARLHRRAFGQAGWLPDAEAAALLGAKPDENTRRSSPRGPSSRVLADLDEALPHVSARGEEFADRAPRGPPPGPPRRRPGGARRPGYRRRRRRHPRRLRLPAGHRRGAERGQ